MSQTLSYRHRKLFTSQPKLVFFRSSPRTVKLERQKAFAVFEGRGPEIAALLKNIEETVPSPSSLTSYPHCECAMMVEVLRRCQETGTERPEPAIGVSEPSCFGCELYFSAFDAVYPDTKQVNHSLILSSRVLIVLFQDLPWRFELSGFRNTVYQPWVSPDLSAVSPGLHAEVQTRFGRMTENACMTQLYMLTERIQPFNLEYFPNKM